MPMLCYCIQINLPVQLEIEILFGVLALGWLSRLDLGLVSHVSSTCCFGPLFRMPRGLVHVSPVALVWKHVISLETAV